VSTVHARCASSQYCSADSICSQDITDVSAATPPSLFSGNPASTDAPTGPGHTDVPSWHPANATASAINACADDTVLA
jgi:hypothetical protein